MSELFIPVFHLKKFNLSKMRLELFDPVFSFPFPLLTSSSLDRPRASLFRA